MAEFMDLETFSPNWELISLESSNSDHESGNLEADCNELIRATTPENSTKAEKLHINNYDIMSCCIGLQNTLIVITKTWNIWLVGINTILTPILGKQVNIHLYFPVSELILCS